MIYGFIIAAGNQSRFKSDIPKALATISDVPILHFNISLMREYCDKVYVVCSNSNRNYFEEYNKLGYAFADLIEINSGLGCGDAVYKALKHITKFNTCDKCYIQWGDSLQCVETFDLLSSHSSDKSVLIPCTTEKTPYVQIIPNSNSVSVHFSKFGDVISAGYHDLSLFYCNCLDLKENLEFMVDKYFNGVNYNLRGNELSFLDVFNYTPITSEVVDAGEVPMNSFNSIEDLNKLCL